MKLWPVSYLAGALLIAPAVAGDQNEPSKPALDQILICTGDVENSSSATCRTHTVEIHTAWDGSIRFPIHAYLPDGYEAVGEVRGIVTAGEEKFGVSGAFLYDEHFGRRMVLCEFYAEGSGLAPLGDERERSGMVTGFCEFTARQKTAALR